MAISMKPSDEFIPLILLLYYGIFFTIKQLSSKYCRGAPGTEELNLSLERQISLPFVPRAKHIVHTDCHIKHINTVLSGNK